MSRWRTRRKGTRTQRGKKFPLNLYYVKRRALGPYGSSKGKPVIALKVAAKSEKEAEDIVDNSDIMQTGAKAVKLRKLVEGEYSEPDIIEVVKEESE